MTTDPTALHGLALRAAVAVEVMQWLDVNQASPENLTGFSRGVCLIVPPWERDRTAAQQVTNRMAELEMENDFAHEVRKILNPTNTWCVATFDLIDASAEILCQAALSVVRESRKGA